MMNEVKWYCRGEVGESIRTLLDAFLDNFIDDAELESELTRLGLTTEEQLEVIMTEIEIQEIDMMSTVNESSTIH